MFAREKISISVSMSFVSPGKIIFNLIFSCNFCLCCCTFLFCLQIENIISLYWGNMFWCLFKMIPELNKYCRGCTGFQLACVADIQRRQREEPRSVKYDQGKGGEPVPSPDRPSRFWFCSLPPLCTPATWASFQWEMQ